ncbi:hypothetical protein [Nonomuraea lactucae]|uniref:hypothetical protein n=1 Tax=Nonomuraea lactucae TaxID=2249762 RepID=UPI000DE51281|nr:hypothetical protein [Nonomuraea lactucae]
MSPLLSAVLPVAERHGLVLAGGHALAAHGLTERPGEGIDFVTDTPRAPVVPADVAEAAAGVVRDLREEGLEASVAEVTPRVARLAVTEPVTGECREVALHREALQRPPITRDGRRLLDLDDALGMAMRALHDRGLAGDLAAVAAAAGLRSFRDLESLARPYTDDFSMAELAMRLEFAELMPDEAFERCGLEPGRAGGVRAFARAWAEDIKQRRAEDGDADYDDPDLPAVD